MSSNSSRVKKTLNKDLKAARQPFNKLCGSLSSIIRELNNCQTLEQYESILAKYNEQLDNARTPAIQQYTKHNQGARSRLTDLLNNIERLKYEIETDLQFDDIQSENEIEDSP